MLMRLARLTSAAVSLSRSAETLALVPLEPTHTWQHQAEAGSSPVRQAAPWQAEIGAGRGQMLGQTRDQVAQKMRWPVAIPRWIDAVGVADRV